MLVEVKLKESIQEPMVGFMKLKMLVGKGFSKPIDASPELLEYIKSDPRLDWREVEVVKKDNSAQNKMMENMLKRYEFTYGELEVTDEEDEETRKIIEEAAAKVSGSEYNEAKQFINVTTPEGQMNFFLAQDLK